MKLRSGRLALATLSLLAMAACGGGSNQAPRTTVTVSGTVSYEFVPPDAGCTALNHGGTFTRPIRGATVQIVNAATGALIGSTASSDSGNYSFSNVPVDTMVRLRVRAELKQGGTPGWDVEVRDNFIVGASDMDDPAPPAFDTRALYVLDGTSFDSGSTNVSRDMIAPTGWGGSNYTGPRAAAPFAILDAIYTGMQFVRATDPNADFPPLDVFWSVNNTDAGPDFDLTAGSILSTSYFPGFSMMFILGDEMRDTDEFDDNVVLHEWGHYFEDNLSRSDSFGGPHSLGESLEASLAFGEGWGTALAAMALNEPIYCDTGVVGFNIETVEFGVQGWFNELSVMTLLYDLWDADNDLTDTGSIGFAPIYNIMTGPQVSTEAFTTMFSFASELRASLNPQGQALVDSQLARENIVSGNGLDIWASNETNNAGVAQDVFPLYTDYIADGSVLNICMNNQLDGLTRDGNNVGEDRYLRISVPLTDEYDVIMAATTPTPATADPSDRDQSDPDFYIYDGPQELIRGWSSNDNLETAGTPTLQAGTTYIAFLEEWRFQDVDGAPASFPSRMCFDVSFTPTP